MSKNLSNVNELHQLISDNVSNISNHEDINRLEEIVKEAIEHNLDLNQYLDNGETLLTQLCKDSYTPAIIVLTKDNRVDVNKCNKSGLHPCECCAWHYDIEILEDAGAKNPYKEEEKEEPHRVNLNGINRVALATMVAELIDGSRGITETDYLKAYIIVNWYVKNNDKDLLAIDKLIYLYYNSNIFFSYSFSDDVVEGKEILQNAVEEERKRNFIPIYPTTEEIEELKKYSYEDCFRVTTETTHWDDKMADMVVLVPKDVPKSPLEYVFLRKEWK